MAVIGMDRRSLGAIDWGNILSDTIGATTRIFEGRFSTPEGYYERSGPGGETIRYRQPTGSNNDIFGAFDTTGRVNAQTTPGGLGTGTLIIGGAALLLFLALRGR